MSEFMDVSVTANSNIKKLTLGELEHNLANLDCNFPLNDPAALNHGSRLVYIASPYSTGGSESTLTCQDFRTRAVANYLHSCVLQGIPAYSPIAHWSCTENLYPQPSHEQYLEVDLKLLSVCANLIILTIPGWDTSTGVARELDFAKSVGMRIFNTPHFKLQEYLDRIFLLDDEGSLPNFTLTRVERFLKALELPYMYTNCDSQLAFAVENLIITLWHTADEFCEGLRFTVLEQGGVKQSGTGWEDTHRMLESVLYHKLGALDLMPLNTPKVKLTGTWK